MRMIQRKLRQDVRIHPAPGFQKLSGMHYFHFLQQLHEVLKPKVYFEIGASLSFATCTSIAVDPQFQLQADVSRNKPQLHLYQGTSDAFFASRLLERLGLAVDLAFLDGMHLFEYLLRDFIQTEANCTPGGMITMHDCVPFDVPTTVRNWDGQGAWVGDVWKLIPILRTHRPDLEITVVDTPPTGIVVLRNLDPSSRVLSDSYDQIIAEYAQIDLESYGIDRFRDVAAVTDASAFTVALDPRLPLIKLISMPHKAETEPLKFRIKLPCPAASVAGLWGEHPFGDSLAAALCRAGHAVKVDTIENWYDNQDPEEIVIVLRGNSYNGQIYEPPSGQSAMLWILYISNPAVTDIELDRYRHVWVASQPYLPRLAKVFDRSRLSVLPQAFDRDLMFPVSAPVRQDVVLVANNHDAQGRIRKMAGHAVSTDTKIAIWGKFWEGTPAEGYLRGQRVENSTLREIYGNATVVLNDHIGRMGAQGFLSNRAFDVLACGTPLVCDPVAWIPEDMEPFIIQVNSDESFIEAIHIARNETDERRSEPIVLQRTCGTVTVSMPALGT